MCVVLWMQEYSGLPGRVRTGSSNTPAYKSRYCAVHEPIVATPHETPDEKRPGIIVNKRVTRNSTTYQVCMHHSYPYVSQPRIYSSITYIFYALVDKKYHRGIISCACTVYVHAMNVVYRLCGLADP